MRISGRSRCRLAVLGALLAALGAPSAVAAPDAGPGDAGPRGDGGPDAVAVEAGVTDGGAGPDGGVLDWHTARVRELTARRAELEAMAEAFGKLTAEQPLPAEALAGTLAADLADPKAAAALREKLLGRRQGLEAQLAEQRARDELLLPPLRARQDKLARYEARQQRRPRLRIPEKIAAEGSEARERIALIELERGAAAAELVLVTAQAAYLERSQPARVAAKAKEKELDLQQQQARRAAERERAKAVAESESADVERRKALEAQRRARTEAERQLAAERARLEGIRGEQARFRQKLAEQGAELLKLRERLGRFRGAIAARSEELKEDWPETAPRYDALYDAVVKELSVIRPRALADLRATLGGLPDVPTPGDALPAAVLRVDRLLEARVARLEKLRLRLAREADKLEGRQDKLYKQRLALLQRETTGLNEHRIAILARVTRAKRGDLTGINRTAFAQLSREITQAIFDALYWTNRRVRQIHRIPRLILDIFTVGSVLWKTVKLIVLLLLLRLALRRWDAWSELAMRKLTARAVGLGAGALRLARLVDVLRGGGPALVALLVGSLVYGILGGHAAAIEVQMSYAAFFWIALYRFQLRAVEGLAKYVGIDPNARALEEEPLELEPLEGPPAPAELKEARARTTGEHARVVPASTLLVRSVRAGTRYILAVALTLELTALAVGKGTLYWLTANFSWYAALPFVFYFLHLWRPHVERIFRERFGNDGKETGLERAVRHVEGKTYGVFVIAAAVAVLFANRLMRFARRYLTSRDATKRLLAFIFRKRVEKHAREHGRVVEKRQELPVVILAQYPMGPLDEDARLLRRPCLDELKAAYAQWEEQHSDGSVALVGHTGMGKTSLLRRLHKELRAEVVQGDVRTKITRPAQMIDWLGGVFGFEPRPRTEAELVAAIREQPKPVVAIDNAQHLFLRQVGGFDAWYAFVRVVSDTCDNTFWVVGLNAVAWEYVDSMAGSASFFRRVVQMKPWSEKAIRRLVLAKMHRAGYGVSFDDLVMAGVDAVELSAQVGRTSAGYFRLLWDFTAGNPKLAAHFWLDSIVPVEGERKVKVHLFAMPAVEKLESLSDDQVFVLTAVAQQQSLTAEEAAATSNLSRDFCNYAFRFFLEHEYLAPEDGTGRMRLSLRWQRPIQRFLKRKHLLYDV